MIGSSAYRSTSPTAPTSPINGSGSGLPLYQHQRHCNVRGTPTFMTLITPVKCKRHKSTQAAILLETVGGNTVTASREVQTELISEDIANASDRESNIQKAVYDSLLEERDKLKFDNQWLRNELALGNIHDERTESNFEIHNLKLEHARCLDQLSFQHKTDLAALEVNLQQRYEYLEDRCDREMQLLIESKKALVVKLRIQSESNQQLVQEIVAQEDRLLNLRDQIQNQQTTKMMLLSQLTATNKTLEIPKGLPKNVFTQTEVSSITQSLDDDELHIENDEQNDVISQKQLNNPNRVCLSIPNTSTSSNINFVKPPALYQCTTFSPKSTTTESLNSQQDRDTSSIKLKLLRIANDAKQLSENMDSTSIIKLMKSLVAKNHVSESETAISLESNCPDIISMEDITISEEIRAKIKAEVKEEFQLEEPLPPSQPLRVPSFTSLPEDPQLLGPSEPIKSESALRQKPVRKSKRIRIPVKQLPNNEKYSKRNNREDIITEETAMKYLSETEPFVELNSDVDIPLLDSQSKITLEVLNYPSSLWTTTTTNKSPIRKAPAIGRRTSLASCYRSRAASSTTFSNKSRCAFISRIPISCSQISVMAV